MSIEKLIIEKEQSLQQFDHRASGNKRSNLLADDFIEFGQSGKIYGKSEIIDYLNAKPQHQISMDDIMLKLLSDNVILLTYRAKKTDLLTNISHYSLRSSIWEQVGNDWQLVFHQGTAVAGEHGESAMPT